MTSASNDKSSADAFIGMLGLAAVKNSSAPGPKRRDGAKKTQVLLNLSLNRGDNTSAPPTRSLFRARSMMNVQDDDDTSGRSNKLRSTNIAPFLQQSDDEREPSKTSVEQTPVLTVIDFKKHMRFATKQGPETYEFDPTPMMQAKGSL